MGHTLDEAARLDAYGQRLGASPTTVRGPQQQSEWRGPSRGGNVRAKPAGLLVLDCETLEALWPRSP